MDLHDFLENLNDFQDIQYGVNRLGIMSVPKCTLTLPPGIYKYKYKQPQISQKVTPDKKSKSLIQSENTHKPRYDMSIEYIIVTI